MIVARSVYDQHDIPSMHLDVAPLMHLDHCWMHGS